MPLGNFLDCAVLEVDLLAGNGEGMNPRLTT
jgi:hypothetical protein